MSASNVMEVITVGRYAGVGEAACVCEWDCVQCEMLVI